MTRSVLCLAALLLAACTGEQATVPPEQAITANAPAAASPPAVPPTAATPALALDGDGLRLFNAENGSARPLPFGLARDPVMAALAFRGPPGTGSNGECSAGPLDFASWPDGLTLSAV